MKIYQNLGMVAALVISSSVSADTIYDNISGVSTFGEGLGVTSGVYVANKFSTLSLCPGGCALGDITLNLTSLDQSPAGFTLEVLKEAVGGPNNLAGPFGETVATMNNPAHFSISYGNDTFTPNGEVILEDNTEYWVKFSSLSASTVYWNYLSNAAVQGQPSLGYFEYNTGCSAFFDTPNVLMKLEATPIGGAPVPVPGAVWMMGSALLGFMATRRRNSHQ